MVNISDYGKIIVDVWNKLPERFQSVELDEFVIMPNHLHGIIKIVGADLCVCPYVEDEQTKKGRTRRFAPTTNGTMVQTMTTNEYIRGINEHEWERSTANCGSAITTNTLSVTIGN